MSGEIESYKVNTLLKQSERDLLMDFRESVNSTFEASPQHAYRTVKSLDESYEGALTDPWLIEYSMEHSNVYASMEKTYLDGENGGNRVSVSVDPGHKLMVSPVTEKKLELEISGVLNIKPEDFLSVISD